MKAPKPFSAPHGTEPGTRVGASNPDRSARVLVLAGERIVADHTAESNVVDQHVRDLRAKFQEITPGQLVIATVPGQGYRVLLDESSPSSRPEGQRLQYCRDVDGSPEFDFDRVQKLDEQRLRSGLTAIAA